MRQLGRISVPSPALPRRLWVLLGAAGLFAMLSENPMLTVAAILVLAILFKLLWRPGEPPVLFYAMAYHWVQASILIFYADAKGQSMDALDLRNISIAGRSIDYSLEPATWLSLAGLVAVAIGMRLGAGPLAGTRVHNMVADVVDRLSVRRLFYGSLLAMLFANGVGYVGAILPPLRVPLLALANAHWIVVYLLTCTVLFQRTGYRELCIVLVLELAVGFLSFFSEFRIVLIVMLMAALSSPQRLNGPALKASVLIVVLSMALGLVWTSIKGDYRAFISGESSTQSITVSASEQVKIIAQLVGDMTLEKISKAGEGLVNRLSYVYFFGEVLRNVPAYVAYEDGALWGDAVWRALVPRMLDPSKPPIDDSARTAEFTGLKILGADVGTSVSLGYVAESYIDFGPLLMMLPLLAWGLFLGWLYRILTRSVPFPLFGYACATVLVVLSASTLEQSNAKMVGGTVVAFLVFYLVQKYFARRLLRWLALPETNGSKLRRGAT